MEKTVAPFPWKRATLGFLVGMALGAWGMTWLWERVDRALYPPPTPTPSLQRLAEDVSRQMDAIGRGIFGGVSQATQDRLKKGVGDPEARLKALEGELRAAKEGAASEQSEQGQPR
jgi:hypothetical protein